MPNLKKILLILHIFFIAGCSDQRKIEDLGFTHTVTFDREKYKGDGEYLKVTLSIPNLESKKGQEAQTLTTVTKTSKEARVKLSQQTNKQIVSGQVRNALFGINLAKKGLQEHIDTFVRDPAIGPNVKISIVNGNAHDLVSKSYPQHILTSRYIDKLLEKEIRTHAVPESTFYKWNRDLFDDGIDPVAPLLTYTNNHVIIDGIALFNEDKFVGKIEPVNAVIFSFLRGDFRQGEFSMEVINEETKQKENVLLSSIVSKRKVSVTRLNSPKKFRVKIDIICKGSILEYNGTLKLSEEEQKRKLEKAISKYIQKKSRDIVTYMQKIKADGIGIGKAVRNYSTYEQWKSMNWDVVYSNLEVVYDIEVKIRDYGKFK